MKKNLKITYQNFVTVIYTADIINHQSILRRPLKIKKEVIIERALSGPHIQIGLVI